MRVEGWESILAAEIEAARQIPFAWGSHDCVIWSANVLLRITGIDHLGAIRGTYRSKAGACRIIKKTGGTLDGCVDARLPRIPVSMARRGDVVRVESGLGICAGTHSFFLTETGLAPVKTRTCEAAWRVD